LFCAAPARVAALCFRGVPGVRAVSQDCETFPACSPRAKSCKRF